MVYLPSGEAVCNFRLAFNFKKRDRIETEWLKVAAWGDELAEQANLLVKGDLVQIIGEVTFSSWTDANGNQRKSCDIRVIEISKVAPPSEEESSP
jgi:single stranded DNA-binding protein